MEIKKPKQNTDVLTYIEKMKDMYEPKFTDQKIFKNNINKKPTFNYLKTNWGETMSKILFCK